MKFVNPWDPKQETDSQNTQSNESQSPSNEVSQSSTSTSSSNETSDGSFWDTLSDLAEGFVETIESLGSYRKRDAESALETTVLNTIAVYTASNVELNTTDEQKRQTTVGTFWLFYDGKKVKEYSGQYKSFQKSTFIKEYGATSGAYGKQSALNQNLKEIGPIPSGEYFIDLRLEITRRAGLVSANNPELAAGHGIQIIPWYRKWIIGSGEERQALYPGWGQWRARLEKIIISSTDPLVESRDNFYLHDSYKGESHGCIETETELYYDLATLKKSGQLKVKLWVHYSSLDTPTNGNTLRNPRPWYHQSISTDSGLIDAPDGKFPDRSRL